MRINGDFVTVIYNLRANPQFHFLSNLQRLGNGSGRVSQLPLSTPDINKFQVAMHTVLLYPGNISVIRPTGLNQIRLFLSRLTELMTGRCAICA